MVVGFLTKKKMDLHYYGDLRVEKRYTVKVVTEDERVP